jgi:hypothetical protein
MVPTTRLSIGSSTQATISTEIAGAADDPIEGRVAGRRFDAVALYGCLSDCGVWLGLPWPNRVKTGGAAHAVDTRAAENR